jgi:aryl-alcohol dehydrogenase-like predicted oxidoreductase
MIYNQFGFGSWQIGDPNNTNGKCNGWNAIPETDRITLVKRSVALGINFFDTA